MKLLELSLSIILPTLITTLPITLPFLSLSDVLVSWVGIVVLISGYNATLISICTPVITKPTTRINAIKSYFNVEIGLIILSNLLLSYFLSGFINIWYSDSLQDNLTLFWTTVTAQYFLFDVLINYKYKYRTSIIKVHYSIVPNYKLCLKQIFKILRYTLPVYFFFYKDITTLTSIVCGFPSDELTYYFLIRPSTLFNMFIVTLVTYTLLHSGFKAVLHVAARTSIPKIKGETSIERCADSLRSDNIKTRYSAVTDLLKACQTSFNSRQIVFSLYDGHPVTWHIIYKEWLKSLENFCKSVTEKPLSASVPASTKTETIKPVGRPLKDVKPTLLYSQRDSQVTYPGIDSRRPLLTSRISSFISELLSEMVISFKKSSKEYLINTRIGKYLLTEQQDVVLENNIRDLGFMLHGSALVELICCTAPSEDKYGVIQLVLPEILDSVVSTLKAIDQVPILGLTTSQIRLKRSLHLFLHRLKNTYQGTLFNLTLNTETASLLQQLTAS